jgi:1,4-dihydroxy-2-naphthoyl-CoA hydrolase
MIWPENINLHDINKLGHNTAVSHLGIIITEIKDDFIAGEMPVDDRTRQPHGVLHGGASVLFAESLGSFASNILLHGTNFAAVGLEVNANHVRSVREGKVFGKATLLHKGRSTHLWEIKITDEKNNLICASRLTMAIIEKK